MKQIINISKTIKLCSVLVFAAFSALAVNAATFNVNTTDDSHDAAPGDGNCLDENGKCSLRAAIEEANAFANTDVINLQDRATYQLQHGTLILETDMEIRGKKDSYAIIRPAPSKSIRLLVTNAGTTVILSDLILRDGRRSDAFTRGVGIWNRGRMTAIRVGVKDNTGTRTSGAGIHNSGTLIFKDGDISGNVNTYESSPTSTASTGGGIYNSGILEIENSSIVNNSATYGGGIYSKSSLNGGNSFNSGNKSRVTLKNVTVTGNKAARGGAGIYTAHHTLEVNSSTIYNNTITGDSTAGKEDHFAGGGAFIFGFYPDWGLLPGDVQRGADLWSNQLSNSLNCITCHGPYLRESINQLGLRQLEPGRFTELDLAEKIHATMDGCKNQCALDLAALLKATEIWNIVLPGAPLFVRDIENIFNRSIITGNKINVTSIEGRNCKIGGLLQFNAFGTDNVWGDVEDYNFNCDRPIFAGIDTVMTESQYRSTSFTLETVGNNQINSRVAVPNGPFWINCSATNPPAHCEAGAKLPEINQLPCSDFNAWKRRNAYNAGARVKYQGNIYEAVARIQKKKNPPSANANWNLIGPCSNDQQGPPSDCDNVGAWKKNKKYNAGAKVKFKNNLYRAKKKIPKKKAKPDVNNDWELLGPC